MPTPRFVHTVRHILKPENFEHGFEIPRYKASNRENSRRMLQYDESLNDADNAVAVDFRPCSNMTSNVELFSKSMSTKYDYDLLMRPNFQEA